MQDDWRPGCPVQHLRLRATLLNRIRHYFAGRDVLEVETPLLSHAIGTDPNLDFFVTDYVAPPNQYPLYLQTSPEFAMKRLLAAGSGSIFQITKVFRNNEAGRFHNPEFSLLEWYRVRFDLNALMDDITQLLDDVCADFLKLETPQRYSYQSVFHSYTGLDALDFDMRAYQHFAKTHNLPEALEICGDNHGLWLDLLFSHYVQPHLGQNAICLVYGYPSCQSSLARLNACDDRISERVELFINGVELGNGYHELTDAHEQERRFDAEIRFRQQNNLPVCPKDKRLLAALASGLPTCSGMAIGIDRLLMLLANAPRIADVLAFDIDRA